MASTWRGPNGLHRSKTGRPLSVLLLALVSALGVLGTATIALLSLAGSWWPPDPTEEDLADLQNGFELVDFGDINCGNGGTYECSWTFLVRYDSSEAELTSELNRLDVNPVSIEGAAPGQSQVRVSWIVSDPGPGELLVALALLLIAAIAAVFVVAAGATLTLRIVERSKDRAPLT